MRHLPSVPVIALACALLAPASVAAQSREHAADHDHAAMAADPGGVPPAGQAAFAAIADVVRRLEADPSTDWSRVDLEALRQHLRDMDEVLLRSTVRQDTVPGGLRLTVTGTGRTAAAISRMLHAHAAQLDAIPMYEAFAITIPGGVRLEVVSRSAAPADIAHLRGLGFAGLLVQGDHHGMHHLQIARGGTPGGHSHRH